MSRLWTHGFGSTRGFVLGLALLVATPSLAHAQFGYGLGYGGWGGYGFPGMGYGYGMYGMPPFGGFGGYGAVGYPGFGYGGFGFPGYGFGHGFYGNPWGFAAVGYPYAYSSIYDWAINPAVAWGSNYTAVASGAVNPYTFGYPAPYYASFYNPLFAMGLSPLAVESALGEYLLSRGRPPLLAPASVPIPIPVPAADGQPAQNQQEPDNARADQ